jgi:hypothetical protein
MKANSSLSKTMVSALIAVALVFSAKLCLAAPSPIINNFNAPGDLAGWGINFGTGSVAWNSTNGVDGSGCLMVTLDASNPANKEVAPLVELGASSFNSADYITVEYDLMIDPVSGTDANGTYGNLQEVLRDATWSWDSHWVGALSSSYNTYTHMTFNVPNNAKTYPRLSLALQGTAPYTTNVVAYVDNLVIKPFVNPLIVAAFTNADEVATWGSGGRATPTFATKDAGGTNPPGSLQIDVAYDETNTGWQEGTMTYSLSHNPARYTYAAFDLYVENPNNLTGFGIVQLFLNNNGWTLVGGRNVNTNMVGIWTHIEMPLPSSVTAASGFIFQFGGGMTNGLRYFVDNVQLYKPVTAPAIGIKRAGAAGVEIVMDDNGSQWQREAISTPAGSGPFTWTSQSTYPVTYSFTITNFPDIASHPGFEAHLYIVNGDTSGGNETYGGADWNVPDIFMLRIENGSNNVICRVDWKTNLPNANPLTNAIYHPVFTTGPTAVGTWSLTFTDPTNAVVTGPGITATNFTLPEEAVLNNFSPATSFMQLGVFKNDGANDGHNNNASGTFSRFQFTGGAAAFDDNFSAATLTNNYVWRVTRASSVTHIPPGTAWWLNWTLPADGYSVISAPTVNGPWDNASVTNLVQRGAIMYGPVSTEVLPPGGAAFFRLAKPAP